MARSTPLDNAGGAKGSGGMGSTRGRLGVSTRSSELDSPSKQMVNKQNKAADSYKIKDLDAMDANKAKYQAAKAAQAAKVADAEKKGMIKGAVVTAGVGAAAAIIADKKKKQGTQPDHYVTDSSNHTKPVTQSTINKAEAELQSKVKSGKVKDITKAKEAISSKTGVWPNGYTN